MREVFSKCEIGEAVKFVGMPSLNTKLVNNNNKLSDVSALLEERRSDWSNGKPRVVKRVRLAKENNGLRNRDNEMGVLAKEDDSGNKLTRLMDRRETSPIHPALRPQLSIEPYDIIFKVIDFCSSLVALDIDVTKTVFCPIILAREV